MLCFSFCASAAQTQLAFAQARVGRSAIDAAVHAEMKRQGLVGVSIGVIRNGRIAYTQGYGVADIERKLRMSPKTVCNRASQSKPFMAVLAMQFVESGKLDSDKPFGVYIPDQADRLHRITTRQLLCHQSGVPH